MSTAEAVAAETRATSVEAFAEVFDRVGEDAAERERERRLPFAEVELLRDAGFTRVTLPPELGGGGADEQTLFELLAELARRDPNLAQLFRSHFSFIDRALHAPPSDAREARLAHLASGAIHGNASFEKGDAKVGGYATRLTADAAGLRLDGRKFYSTGTLFADLVSVLAFHDGELVSALVPTDAAGVTRLDDWDGFGQRLTGSGTTVFEGVRVDASDVIERDGAPSHAGAFVQLVLLAVLAGIGRAVVDDAVRFVQERTRTYSHASAAPPREDPIVQETVGELSALSFAADAALAVAVGALQASSDAIRAGAPAEEIERRIAEADLAATRAQLVIVPNVLKAATELFEVGGASALSQKLALDRHWRNARTVASHNPARFKARVVGDHLLNGTPVLSWWTNGEA
ncbi:acyl-CoA dehydrogenase family protein [Salinibacterium sp. ZJ77]|uniref:acyl-CoA dehydrogenase family protein n=1 Tax=Salinibacterium sp. ZJ77 TaxID=2708337 RepID=UPI00142105AF|nr:acyl-CoA dehydrogenase family protein [Salinibacterium sp. ZJ77]